MSSYIRTTKNLNSGKWESAAWIDDYFGRHHYGVIFLDGEVFDPEETNLQTTDEIKPEVIGDWNKFKKILKKKLASQSKEQHVKRLGTRTVGDRTAVYTTKDSGDRVQFDSGFQRDTNNGKPRYDLIPHELLTRLAELMGRGAEKYSANNWRLATSDEEIQRFKESAYRHFVQWFRGDQD